MSSSKVRIPINPHHHLGYSFHKASIVRHRHLNAIAAKHGYVSLIRRLNALRILLKNNAPTAAAKASADMHYVQKKYDMYKKAHGIHVRKRKSKKSKKSSSGKKRRRRHTI